MTRDLAILRVTDYLREHFGRMLEPREARRARRAGGLTWVVRVVVAAASFEVPIGEIDVGENGELSPELTVEDVVRALRRPTPSQAQQPPSGAFNGTVGLFDEVLAAAAVEHDGDEPLVSRIYALLTAGDEPSLREARDLMPRLLGDPGRRGTTLLRMADIERRLGDRARALGYVDAAAREFADRFAMPALEQAAAMALDLLGAEAFRASPVHHLLERCRSRLQAVDDLFEPSALASVPEEHRAWLQERAVLRTLSPGETLVKEGDPSWAIFVVKSGLFAVQLEKPVPRLVRCCPPGWLLGETSVLNPVDPRCTATLRAEQVSEVWQIDAAVMLQVLRHSPEVMDRIAATKKIHRLDSFLSMHETMSQLDIQVRDELMACLQSIQSFDDETVLLLSGDVPDVACLVALGEVTLHDGWDTDGEPVERVGVDRFIGMRDALHQIPSPFTAVVRRGSTVAFFDAERVRALVDRSPPQLGVMLERLA